MRWYPENIQEEGYGREGIHAFKICIGATACTYSGRNRGGDVSLHFGYAFMTMIAYRCGFTYSKALETMKGIREGVYTNNSRSTVELTKDQKMMLEKLSIEL